MQIYYERLESDPDHIAWVKCRPENISLLKEIFPVENYEILVGIKPNYDPITCDVHTLNNPPAPTWGVDIRKRTNGRSEGLSLTENKE